jgi:hypothetical protein
MEGRKTDRLDLAVGRFRERQDLSRRSKDLHDSQSPVAGQAALSRSSRICGTLCLVAARSFGTLHPGAGQGGDTMPFKSKAQRRKFAELLVQGKITDEAYERWNQETGRAELPEHVAEKSRKRPAKTTSKPGTTSRASSKTKSRASH